MGAFFSRDVVVNQPNVSILRKSIPRFADTKASWREEKTANSLLPEGATSSLGLLIRGGKTRPSTFPVMALTLTFRLYQIPSGSRNATTAKMKCPSANART